MPSTLNKARARIQAQLDSEKRGVFTTTHLQAILAKHRQEWGLAQSVTVSEFIRFLVAGLDLRQVTLRSERYAHKTRYGWRDPSPYLIGLSLRPRSYLSHGTAVFLHGLNDQLTKSIYVNQEQSAKPRGGRLSQERLTLAFTHRQRMSGYIYSLDGFRVTLLSGKHSGNLGVVDAEGPAGESLPTTSVARTLIDIVVRPAYAGGIVQVLQAYRGARGRFEASEIVRVLQKLDYIYPYHQAIGFLMERAEYSSVELSKLSRLGIKFDFYLIHGMKKQKYDPKWRLFFPEGV